MQPSVEVLESAKFICENAVDVFIDDDAVSKVAERIVADPNFFSLHGGWSEHELNPKVQDEHMLNWIFVVDTLNFCFWADEGEPLFCCEHRGRPYTGYWALCACINRALDDGIPITDPSYYANWTLEDCKKIFRSSSAATVPMLEERHKALQEAGQVLQLRYGGSVKNMVLQCEGNCQRLVEELRTHFISYRDECIYKGRRVWFLKRAQIFVSDVWAAFEGKKNYGHFEDVDLVTMFADYRVPQMLQAWQVLRYSEKLEKSLKKNATSSVTRGSEWECEIRGCSIESVRRIVEKCHQLQEKQKNGEKEEKKVVINSITVDFYLWDTAKQLGDKISQYPIHKLKTWFY